MNPMLDEVRGGTSKMEKPMDQPKGKYTVNESVPQDDFCEHPMGDLENQGNAQDRSKKFV